MTSSEGVTPETDLNGNTTNTAESRQNNASETRLPQIPAPISNTVETEVIKHNIKVVNQRGDETYFSLKPTTRMEKLMSAWYQRSGAAQGTKRFLFDGSQITAGDTPASLEMEIEDIIEVFEEQTGGTGARTINHDETSVDHPVLWTLYTHHAEVTTD